MSAALLHGTALSQVAVPDFRLPPSAPTTSPEPQRQGPVAPDLPQSRATPTPTPSPAPTSQPAVQPPPLVVPPAAAPAPTPIRSPRPAPTPTPTPAASPVRQTAPEAEPSAAATEPSPGPVIPATEPTPAASDAPQPLPASPAPATQETDESGVTLLGWLALAGLLAGGALLLVLRRRRAGAEPDPQPVQRVPPDVPPTPVPVPRPAPAPMPAPAPAAPVNIGLAGVDLHVTAGRLSLSLMNAALTFQLTLRHDGPVPLTGMTVRADLIGAHAALQQEEQLGGPAADAPMIAQLPALPSGETQTIAGEVRLPLAQVAAIRQGRSSLFVPLLRLALEEGEGGDRRTLTLLVGPPGQGGQVQPVQLDAGPRVVAPLQARVLG